MAGKAVRPGVNIGLRMRVENIAKPRNRKPRLMKILPHLRETQDRLRDAAGQHVEGDQLADGHVAVDDGIARQRTKWPPSPAC